MPYKRPLKRFHLSQFAKCHSCLMTYGNAPLAHSVTECPSGPGQRPSTLKIRQQAILDFDLRSWHDSKPSTWLTTSCDDSCPGPLYPDSPSPRSPQISHSHCRWGIQSTDFALNCPKLPGRSQSPRAAPSTWIESHPFSTSTATRLGH